MRISDWRSDVCSSDLLKASRRTSVAFSDEDEMLSTFTASGISVPLVEARIVDELMNPLPHDGRTRGELVLRAPWLTSAYAGDAKASEALWHGGWMPTPAIAKIDAQGGVQLRDRSKDTFTPGRTEKGR